MTKDAWISVIPIVISIIALMLSIGGHLNDMIFPGNTVPLTPSFFGIINGVPGFPSHQILIPLEFFNSWKVKDELITRPYLKLHKVGSNLTLNFTLKGEYPKISNQVLEGQALEGDYDYERTFIIPPRSVSLHRLAFQIENWWNPLSKYYNSNSFQERNMM